MIKFWAGATACLVGLCAGYGLASRNSSGTMSAINGPYTAGSVISSSVINARLADVETELTDSKSRSGKGDFSAPARGADGTVAAPTWSYTSETGSGLYRIGSSDHGFSMAGTKVGEWTVNGYRSANGAVATPSLSFFNDTGSGLYRAGSNDLRFAVNGADVQKWVAAGVTITGTQSTSGTSTFATGNTKLAIDGTTITNYAGLWMAANATSPSTTNYALISNGTVTAVNAPTGGSIPLSINNTTKVTVDGNGLTIGSGTAIAQLNYGSCTLDNATPSKCTATVVAGAKCTATTTGTTSAKAAITLAVSVSATTLTITASTGVLTDVVNYICAG